MIDRTSWGRQFDACWLCGIHEGYNLARLAWIELETHELVGNSRRQRAMVTPATWFRACPGCHARLSSSPSPDELAILLAIKERFDPDHYDLLEVNKLLSPNRRGDWADGPVTQAEVDEAYATLYGRTVDG